MTATLDLGLVAVLDVGRQCPPQGLEFPDGLVTIEFGHIIPKGALHLAIGLRVLWRGVDELDPQVVTEGFEESPPKRDAIVKEHALRNHPPLAHGGT